MPPLELSSVDDVLGPRAGRFLGEGFKQAGHALSGITITPQTGAGTGTGTGAGTAAGITATAHLTPPPGHPHHQNTAPTPTPASAPRLNTIDAMLFGAQLTGLYAAHTHQLAPDAHFAVRHLEMRAGTGRAHDEPERFPVSGRPVPAQQPGPPTETTLNCRIGSLSAQIHTRHSPARPARLGGPGGAGQAYDLPEELPGPWNEAPYGIAHTARRQLLTQVSVLVADGRACARATLAAPLSAAVPAGAPATMVDAFVAVLQLGQVLLYTLDGVEAGHGDHLRMRRARITAAPASAARPTDQATAALAQAQLLPFTAGIWRTAQIRGALHGIQVQAHVAHLLPASWPGRERPHRHLAGAPS
ncbi:AvrD family protein [Streptomyces venezuelae]|uniref:AvrD family protein n=1 Tax=Streptomyces venezuelae TaxID=54571 RepID=UPI003658A1D9